MKTDDISEDCNWFETETKFESSEIVLKKNQILSSVNINLVEKDKLDGTHRSW